MFSHEYGQSLCDGMDASEVSLFSSPEQPLLMAQTSYLLHESVLSDSKTVAPRHHEAERERCMQILSCGGRTLKQIIDPAPERRYWALKRSWDGGHRCRTIFAKRAMAPVRRNPLFGQSRLEVEAEGAHLESCHGAPLLVRHDIRALESTLQGMQASAVPVE
jgi:hypothetical protein